MDAGDIPGIRHQPDRRPGLAMPRQMTTAMREALADRGVLLLHFLQLDFDTGALRLTTGGHDVIWDGYTWKGDGTLVNLSSGRENLQLQANGVEIELSGADAALVSLALSEHVRRRRFRMWVAAVDKSTGGIVPDPVLEHDLELDVARVIDDRGEQ